MLGFNFEANKEKLFMLIILEEMNLGVTPEKSVWVVFLCRMILALTG